MYCARAFPRRQSGKLTLVEGTETDLDPASTDKYMCGTREHFYLFILFMS